MTIAVSFTRCNNDESSPTSTLPSGCQSQGVYAISVLQSNVSCLATNAFTDAEELIGAPDAAATGPDKTEFTGFVSLGIDGSISVYMGSCVQDLAGPDIRVYQSVAAEAVEVQVSQNTNGPFVSLGIQECGKSTPFFSKACDFNLTGSGLSNVRVIKVIDQSRNQAAISNCDNVGLSPGADIDAVEVLHPGN